MLTPLFTWGTQLPSPGLFLAKEIASSLPEVAVILCHREESCFKPEPLHRKAMLTGPNVFLIAQNILEAGCHRTKNSELWILIMGCNFSCAMAVAVAGLGTPG
ncbi:hypothetical protein RRG08_015299 [Elysia crispata]|uniref:Uncharacterized protein n=1 Tax=Elysia crispata TaxID=231223 RepID=A0AAE0ZVM9_9GAST|nr:hypothetical protein RRG08_015299 [Elysia crispata]